MSPERWDALSITDRVTVLRRHDRSLREDRWFPLVNAMANSRFSELTPLQQDAVREIK